MSSRMTRKYGVGTRFPEMSIHWVCQSLASAVQIVAYGKPPRNPGVPVRVRWFFVGVPFARVLTSRVQVEGRRL